MDGFSWENMLGMLYVPFVRAFFFEFDPQNGVWINRINRNAYCTKCFSSGRMTPLRDIEIGYVCAYCDKLFYKKTAELYGIELYRKEKLHEN